MPLRCPPGALPDAYRFICLRAVRALARRQFDIAYAYPSDSSKKCLYCTQQKEKCDPVPEYVFEEFHDLIDAIELCAIAWYGPAVDADTEVLLDRIAAAALDIARKVQVVRSQEKELSVNQLLVAQNQVLRDIRDSISELVDTVNGMERRLSRLEARSARGGARVGPRVEESEEWSGLSSSSEEDKGAVDQEMADAEQERSDVEL
ncbi:uncharacterized protein yc1106_05263 [Curvularia clavata]|uniref:Uncharacterized protein n=1 Tax=Curvularia clavata TaxID=95742 RepID=A0A9Q8ZAP6_CURCL|nr:uncharacterized protein yc1106_05263 [Curvularia clavata]